MTLFDAPSVNYPRKWKEYSFDFQLMFVYHLCMMALFMAGGALSVKQELLATVVLIAVLLFLSGRYRRSMNWRWPGVQAKGKLTAIGIIVLAALFEFAAIPLAPLSDPTFLPWHMAAIGISVFGVLTTLRVIQLSKSDFSKACEAAGADRFQPKSVSETIPIAPTDPLWKRALRGMYGVFFLLVWLDAVASFYYFGVAFREGSSIPTPNRTEWLNNHGQIMYVLHSQKALIDSLHTVMAIGIPSGLAIGVILHFFVGVKLFSNMPTLEEWKKK